MKLRDITKIEVLHNHAGMGRAIYVYHAGRVPKMYKYTTRRENMIKTNSHVFKVSNEQRITSYLIH